MWCAGEGKINVSVSTVPIKYKSFNGRKVISINTSLRLFHKSGILDLFLKKQKGNGMLRRHGYIFSGEVIGV